MQKFLLTVTEGVGDRFETISHILVPATDPGYAKYHWHKMMNQQGGHKRDDVAPHYYEANGWWAELKGVRQVEEEERDTLEELLTEIPGFNPD